MCIGEMAKKAKKESGFIIRCSYCVIDDFRLEDVKEDAEVKHYTDSPFKIVKAPLDTKKPSAFKMMPMDEDL
jgi:hypothetical protein